MTKYIVVTETGSIFRCNEATKEELIMATSEYCNLINTDDYTIYVGNEKWIPLPTWEEIGNYNT